MSLPSQYYLPTPPTSRPLPTPPSSPRSSPSKPFISFKPPSPDAKLTTKTICHKADKAAAQRAARELEKSRKAAEWFAEAERKKADKLAAAQRERDAKFAKELAKRQEEMEKELVKREEQLRRMMAVERKLSSLPTPPASPVAVPKFVPPVLPSRPAPKRAESAPATSTSTLSSAAPRVPPRPNYTYLTSTSPAPAPAPALPPKTPKVAPPPPSLPASYTCNPNTPNLNAYTPHGFTPTPIAANPHPRSNPFDKVRANLDNYSYHNETLPSLRAELESRGLPYRPYGY